LFLAAYLPVLKATTARAVLGSSFVMSVGSIGFQTFLGAFFISRYGLTTADLAPVLGIGSIGVLIGSQVAGRLGNRIGHKAIMSVSVLAASVLALVELYTTTSVVFATLLNFLVWIPMGMRFTSASTIISEAVPSSRGTMNALNTAAFNGGTVIGAYFGSVVVESAGYEPLGILMLAGAIVSAALIALFVVEADAAEPAFSGAA
jgi:AAHS family 4-hydroxybenzoate transporter-like MFS transporter